MSKRAEQMAAEVVSAVLSSKGITKAAGGTAPPGLLMAVALPLCQIVVEQDRQARRTAKHSRRVNKAIKRNQAILNAIARPTPSSAPSPMRLPQREQIPLRAGEWTTSLTRIAGPKPMNGHSHPAEDRNPPAEPPPDHPG